MFLKNLRKFTEAQIPSGESVFVTPLDQSTARIESIPITSREFSYGDVVTLVPREHADPLITKVVSRGGYKTACIRLRLDDGYFRGLMKEIERESIIWQVDLDLIAVTALETELPQILQRLESPRWSHYLVHDNSPVKRHRNPCAATWTCGILQRFGQAITRRSPPKTYKSKWLSLARFEFRPAGLLCGRNFFSRRRAHRSWGFWRGISGWRICSAFFGAVFCPTLPSGGSDARFGSGAHRAATIAAGARLRHTSPAVQDFFEFAVQSVNLFFNLRRPT